MKTFDEWFVGKYGSSFDELHMQPHMAIRHAVLALSTAVREYVTDAVHTKPEPCLHVQLRNDKFQGTVCDSCGVKFTFRALSR